MTSESKLKSELRSGKQVSEELEYTLGQYKFKKSRGENVGDLQTELLTKLRSLDQTVQDCKKWVREIMAGSHRSMSDRELSDCRRRLKQLESTTLSLHNEFSSFAVGSSERDHLFSGTSSDNRYGVDKTRYTGMSSQQLEKEYETEINAHDQYLESIGRGVDNIHEIGIAIGDEVDRQEPLLSRTIDRTGQAADQLKSESSRIKLTAKQAQVCWLQCIVCLLLVVIIGLVIGKFA